MFTSTPTAGVPARTAVALHHIPTGTRVAELPSRALDPAELLELAASVVAEPERWRPHVAFVDGQDRHFACLVRTEHVEVWLLCWTPSNDTGWHDHDVSSGSVVVVDGLLLEHNLALGGPEVVTEIESGRGFAFGPDHIHRLTGVAEQTVSVHAYSPPLQRMGQYSIGGDGLLRRTSVSYTAELPERGGAMPG